MEFFRLLFKVIKAWLLVRVAWLKEKRWKHEGE